MDMTQSSQLPAQRYTEVTVPLEEFQSNEPERLVEEAVPPTIDEVGTFVFVWFHNQKAMLASIHHMHRKALQFAEAARWEKSGPYIPLGIRAGPLLCVALSAVAIIRDAADGKETERNITRGERRACYRMARGISKMLQHLSKSATELCLGKAHLVKAELLSLQRKRRRHNECLRLYKIAIGLSTAANHLLDQALANECTANFLLQSDEQHDRMEGIDFLDQAMDAYSQWGAVAKASRLQERLDRLRGR